MSMADVAKKWLFGYSQHREYVVNIAQENVITNVELSNKVVLELENVAWNERLLQQLVPTDNEGSDKYMY